MQDLNTMNEELSFTDAFCSEYEKLLDDCQRALCAWSERSETARRSQSSGESVGRELLRLQARFAKSYAILQKHTHICNRCLAVANMKRFIAESADEGVRLSVN